MVLRTEAHNLRYEAVIGTVPDCIPDRLRCTVALAHTSKPRPSSFLRYLLYGFVF